LEREIHTTAFKGRNTTRNWKVGRHTTAFKGRNTTRNWKVEATPENYSTEN
jgi:hypothetical protein